jgi:protein-disulfide isomerase
MSASAADDAKEPAITHSQADAILSELRQIRQLLEQQPRQAAIAPPAAPLPQKRSMKIEGGYVLGSSDAPLTMVEFTDYQCPFCRQFEANTFNEIKRLYIDTGKLRFVSRNFPLNIHSNARRAASAALCAGDQGQFWPMREALFRPENSLTEAEILAGAPRLHLDPEQFRACLQSDKHKLDILKDMDDATALQIDATPSFLIGKSTPYGLEGYIVAGAQPFAQFDQRLKESEAGH